MFFALVIEPDQFKYTYGRIPNVGRKTRDVAEVFELEDDDWDLLDPEFTGAAYRICGALLDFSDIDYLDAQQCALLQGWLDSRLQDSLEPRLQTLYGKLLEFTRRAQELGTGVVIEF